MILRYSAQDYTTSSGRDVTDAHLTLTLDLPDPISDYLVQNRKYPNEILRSAADRRSPSPSR